MNENKFTNKIILVVDDEIDLRDIIASELEFMGARVLTAESIGTAQNILKDNKIDLVVSDIRMPGGTGIDLLEHIKKNYSISLPVLLVTGFADVTDEQAYSLGAEALMHKPFKLDELIDTVERFLEDPLKRLVIKSPITNHHKVEHASEVKMGRGGVAIELLDGLNSYEVGQTIKLDGSGLKGSGTIRWVKPSKRLVNNSWIGVEFSCLDEAGISLVKEKINSRLLSFIPLSEN